jgi:hypothetical protein
MIYSLDPKLLETIENDIKNERRISRHKMNKDIDDQNKLRQNQKNNEKIGKLEKMSVFRGHPVMKRVGKQKVKKSENKSNIHDEDGDYKRYV